LCCHMAADTDAEQDGSLRTASLFEIKNKPLKMGVSRKNPNEKSVSD
jgi:hypothetical protein